MTNDMTLPAPSSGPITKLEMVTQLERLALQFPRPDLDRATDGWRLLYEIFWADLKRLSRDHLKLLCDCYSHNPKHTRFPTVGQLLDAASAAGLGDSDLPKRDSESVYERFGKPASRPIGADIGPNPDAKPRSIGQGAQLPNPPAAPQKPPPTPMPEPTQSADELKKMRLETLQKRLERAGETWA